MLQYFVTAAFDYRRNVLNITTYLKGKVIGQYQVPIQGLDFRDRHPLVVQQALHDIVKNKLIEWSIYNTPEGHGQTVPTDYPFVDSNQCLVFHTFNSENTRITIRSED